MPTPAFSGVLLANLASTWLLVGLVWTVQLVHYPLFARVGAAEWDAYHQQHMKMITVIVAPVMFIEALAAAVLVFLARDLSGAPKVAIWIAAGLVLVNWFSTAGIQVPYHNQLGKGLDVATVQKLVNSNWLRTVSWTARGLLLVYVAWAVLPARASAAVAPG